MSAIEVSNLNKTFGASVKALNNVTMRLEPGEMVALIGASGSGKSTLIRHIAGLVEADKGAGQISINGELIQENGKIGSNVRKIRSRVGVVFQQFNLVSRLSVLTNVLTGHLGQIPRWRGTLGLFTEAEKKVALSALARVNIDRLAMQRSSTLSGGQQQRAAIARAITQGAEIVLADEPIASLDPSSSRKVMDTLQKINREDGVTVLVSLHQVDYAVEYCPRTIAMRDGKVVFDGATKHLTPAFLQELYGDESLNLMSTGAAKAEDISSDHSADESSIPVAALATA